MGNASTKTILAGVAIGVGVGLVLVAAGLVIGPAIAAAAAAKAAAIAGAKVAAVATYTGVAAAIGTIGVGAVTSGIYGVASGTVNEGGHPEKNLADDLNKEGEKKFNEGYFEGALDCFGNAVRESKSNDPNLPKYKANVERTKAAIANQTGTRQLNNGNHHDAINSFIHALNIIPNQFTSDKTRIENNLSNAYNRLGNDLYDKNEFEKALEYYKKANETNRSNEYEHNIKKAQSAINNKNAEKFYHEGWKAFNRKDYSTALKFFDKAYNTSEPGYINKSLFQEQRDRSQAEIYNVEGEKLFNQGLYEQARNLFQSAINRSPAAYKGNFKHNLNKANGEILYKEAMQIYNDGKYQEAIQKFKDALNTFPNSEINRIVRAKDSLANAYNKYGESELSKNNFKTASESFESAIDNASKGNSNINIFLKNKSIADWGFLWLKAKDFENRGAYEEAILRLDSALETIPQEQLHNLNELKRLKYKTHRSYGIKLANVNKNFQYAKKQFEIALELTENDFEVNELQEKITDAQINFLQVEYDDLLKEAPNMSNEIAADNIIALFEAFKVTLERRTKSEHYDQLIVLIEELNKRQCYDEILEAADIGIKFFPEKKEEFVKIKDIKRHFDEDTDYLNILISPYEHDKVIEAELQTGVFR